MYLVIDIGSNTVRAVIFRVENKELIPVLNKKYPAGLASYIGKDGMMNEDGIAYLLEILEEIKIIVDAFPLDRVYPFATASLRNISNSVEVMERVKRETGFEIELISGREEAYYDYYAAIRELAAENGNESKISDELGILTDIGGGSTEIVVYCESQPVLAESVPIGSLNMFNAHGKGIILSEGERKKVYKETLESLEFEKFKLILGIQDMEDKCLCGVGGSCRSALKLYNAMNKKKHNREFPIEFLNEIYEGEYSDKRLIAAILRTAPERIHTLLPGMMILKAVADYFHIKKVKVNRHGVREGYLYYKLEKEGIIRE